MISRVLTGWLGILAPVVVLAAPTAAPSFRPVTVDDQVTIGYGVAVADVDGDGRPDLVLADKQVIAWYHNPDWTKHVMAERLTELDHVCVAARDIDGDGKAEVAAGAGWNPGDTVASGALFYLKAPEDRTQRWQPIRLAHDPTIHRIRWARNAAGAFDLISVPLHGRGNKNGAGDGVRVLAYHRPADVTGAWTSSLLNDSWHASHNFDVIPEASGRPESLCVATKEGLFGLTPAGGLWNVTTVVAAGAETPEFVGAGEVRVGRSTENGTLVAAIEPMHGNQVVVYRSSPGVRVGDRGTWKRTVLDATLVDGHGLVCADLLGLGRDQVVAGWRAMNVAGKKVGIRLYVPTDGTLDRWETHVIDDNAMACEDLQTADLDGDGDLDLVASGRATRNLKIYFNERKSP